MKLSDMEINNLVNEFSRIFLERSRNTRHGTILDCAIDNALCKLYSYSSACQKEIEMLAKAGNCDVLVCRAALEASNNFYILGLLYNRANDPEGMEIWMKILKGELIDCFFPGIDAVVQFLSKSPIDKKLGPHTDWILRQNSKYGAKIFSSDIEEGLTETILSYLEPYGNNARCAYLEHLVTSQKCSRV